jgi:DNA adenine methylase
MSVTAIANWYGCARMVAEDIGPLFEGCPLVVVGFGGGMPELAELSAKKILVSDLHRHVINLADTMKHPTRGPELYRRLRRIIFHPYVLARAQERCRERERANAGAGLFATTAAVVSSGREPDVTWAEDYAITSWMGRGGNAGTKTEFRGALPIRFSPGGGGSAQRFHNWVTSIPAWRRILRRCEFSVADAFEVIAAAHDSEDVGIYSDAPWVGAGDKYTHSFTIEQHRRLAVAHARFKESRVVVRYGDDPLIRDLYPSIESGGQWKYITYDSRSQQNSDVKEVLILNPPAAARMAA